MQRNENYQHYQKLKQSKYNNQYIYYILQYVEAQVQAISEDPDIFDYDAWKDNIKEEEAPKTEEEKRERKRVSIYSNYYIIASLY